MSLCNVHGQMAHVTTCFGRSGEALPVAASAALGRFLGLLDAN